MTKEFAFQERLGDGAAVDFGKGLIPSWGEEMQSLRNELFARASFANNQCRSVNTRQLRHMIECRGE